MKKYSSHFRAHLLKTLSYSYKKIDLMITENKRMNSTQDSIVKYSCYTIHSCKNTKLLRISSLISNMIKI